MNAKYVLSKILALVNAEQKEVQFTDAMMKDGTILQSPTFDLGEEVKVVGEDGSLTPAPNGEHEIALKDSEGNEVVIRIETEDGKITSRENVEESSTEAPELPESEVESEVEMAAETLPAHALPNTTDEDPRNSLGQDTDETDSPIISELKAKIKELELELEKYKLAEELPAEDELPKLDGAPIEEEGVKMSAVKAKVGNKGHLDSQSRFLSKLYK